MLVETWFFDRKFYSLFDDATRLAILATLGGGVCAATNKLAGTCDDPAITCLKTGRDAIRIQH